MCRENGLDVVKMIIYSAKDIFPQYTNEQLKIREGLVPDQKINIYVECKKLITT